MKQQIYQNGFYLMIGLILGALITIISVPKSSPKPSENTIRIEMVKDSAKVTSKDKNVKVAQVKPVAKPKVRTGWRQTEPPAPAPAGDKKTDSVFCGS